MNQTLVIGIAGGSGSGKTSVAKLLATSFPKDATIIRQDDYYKSQRDLSAEERILQNYDCPSAFDTDLMVEQIDAFIRREEIDVPIYDYTVHDRSKKVRHIHPTRILIIEGILVLAEERLRNYMDIKIFIDTDADVRILRRIRRDVNKRRRSMDSVIEQYLTTVKPMHEAYVEPSKKYADIIIPDGSHNSVAMEMLKNRLQRHLGIKQCKRSKKL